MFVFLCLKLHKHLLIYFKNIRILFVTVKRSGLALTTKEKLEI